MYQQSTVTMTMRELDRLKVIQAVVGGELRVGAAAERLGISTRQVRRLTERYRLEGPVGLISRLRNRPSNRRLQDSGGGRIVDSTQVEASEDSAAEDAASLRGRACPNRRLRASLVRRPGADVYCARLRR